MLKAWKGGAFAKPPFKDFSVLFQVGAVATTPLKLFAKRVVPPPLFSSAWATTRRTLGWLFVPPSPLSLCCATTMCVCGASVFAFNPLKISIPVLCYTTDWKYVPLPPPLLPFTTKSCLRREKVGIVSHVSQCSLLSLFGNTEILLQFQEGFLSFVVQRWKNELYWSISTMYFTYMYLIYTVLSGWKFEKTPCIFLFSSPERCILYATFKPVST